MDFSSQHIDWGYNGNMANHHEIFMMKIDALFIKHVPK